LYILEIEMEPGAGLRGLRVCHDKHLYGELTCGCGHVNRSEPGRCPADPLWSVGLSEWHLVGPLLVSLLVCLSQRMHLSRRRIQEFLRDWLGIELSTSTINQCIHEAGRAVEPIEEQLVEELQQASLAYADETPWKEWGQLLWLWVIITPTICLYFIGYRSKEILAHVFGEGFVGWLMSDGYQVYRHFQQRLRCWAHLLRKAEGLKQSLNAEARAFGQATHDLLSDLMAAIYRAREGPPVDLTPRFRDRLDAFRRLCEQHRDSAHEKTRALAREFLNDWEAVWIVVTHPYLPLTNNEAERALRHWVIARLLSQGTRTEQGSRAFALLASVIDTCRRRNILPWPYLAKVVAERRKGHPAPPLPAAA
jgi:AcrR family transcriptional regulator